MRIFSAKPSDEFCTFSEFRDFSLEIVWSSNSFFFTTDFWDSQYFYVTNWRNSQFSFFDSLTKLIFFCNRLANFLIYFCGRLTKFAIYFRDLLKMLANFSMIDCRILRFFPRDHLWNLVIFPPRSFDEYCNFLLRPFEFSFPRSFDEFRNFFSPEIIWKNSWFFHMFYCRDSQYFCVTVSWNYWFFDSLVKFATH